MGASTEADDILEGVLDEVAMSANSGGDGGVSDVDDMLDGVLNEVARLDRDTGRESEHSGSATHSGGASPVPWVAHAQQIRSPNLSTLQDMGQYDADDDAEFGAGGEEDEDEDEDQDTGTALLEATDDRWGDLEAVDPGNSGTGGGGEDDDEDEDLGSDLMAAIDASVRAVQDRPQGTTQYQGTTQSQGTGGGSFMDTLPRVQGAQGSVAAPWVQDPQRYAEQ